MPLRDRDPYYHTPVRETKRGFFIHKPPKGSSPISIIINEGEFSAVEKHHMIRIQPKQSKRNHTQEHQDQIHPSNISTDTEETTTTLNDERRTTRAELLHHVEKIREINISDHDTTSLKAKDNANTSTNTKPKDHTKKVLTKAKLKSGPTSSSSVPSVYQGVTLQTLGRVSSSISTSLRRTYSRRSRSLSRGRSSSSRSIASSEHDDDDTNDEDHNDEGQELQSSLPQNNRRQGAVLQRVRSFSLNAKDKIRSRSRSIVRTLRRKKHNHKEQMVFVQQSYEEEHAPSSSMHNTSNKTATSSSTTSNGRPFLGFFCGGLDAFCGTHDDEYTDRNDDTDQNSIRF
jgi:hypothetical protein